MATSMCLACPKMVEVVRNRTPQGEHLAVCNGKPPPNYTCFLPLRALVAAMAPRAGNTRPKAMARLEKIFIRCHAVWQVAVTQRCQNTSPFRRILMLSYQPCRRINVLCCTRTSCPYRPAESCWRVHGGHVSRQGPKNTRKARIRMTELKVRIAPAPQRHPEHALRAGIASMSAIVAASQAPGL